MMRLPGAWVFPGMRSARRSLWREAESLLRHVRLNGCYLKREGGAHSLWCNPKTGQNGSHSASH